MLEKQAYCRRRYMKWTGEKRMGRTCFFKHLERTSDKCYERWRWSSGDGVSPSSAVIPPPPRQETAGSFAYDCLTEPIKSSLFYRRGLIELARLPSLALFSILKITYFLFISWRCSRPPIHLHSSFSSAPPLSPCKVGRGSGPTSN